MCFFASACFSTCVPTKVESGFSVCCTVVVDGIFVWGGGMTAAFGCLDAGGPEVDAVGADGCGGVGSSAAG